MSDAKAVKVLKVGGQAVMEGVMMRSPNSLAVAVRRMNGEIVLREAPWRPILAGWRFLRWPFVRGSLVLVESLVNGISALNFSARVAMADAEEEEKRPTGNDEPPTTGPRTLSLTEPQEVSNWTIWSTVAFALLLAIGLFIALPHLAVWLGSRFVGRELGVADFSFHLITGLVKMGVFIGYIALISLMKDIRRVFMYHGAEHQSIYAYEDGRPLTVEVARQYAPMHPRCGTTFLIMVIALSILVFALAFPLLLWLVGQPTGIPWLDHFIYILVKLPLLFPIAGLAYEIQRLTSRFMDHTWARMLAWPGLAVQRLTTRRPTDDQLEVALTSLRKALWREKRGPSEDDSRERISVYADYEAVVRELGDVA